jgi:hypothetical protein
MVSMTPSSDGFAFTLGRMLFPFQLAAMMAGFGQSTGFVAAAAVVLLAVGAFLTFKAHSRN